MLCDAASGHLDFQSCLVKEKLLAAGKDSMTEAASVLSIAKHTVLQELKRMLQCCGRLESLLTGGSARLIDMLCLRPQGATWTRNPPRIRKTLGRTRVSRVGKSVRLWHMAHALSVND